MHDFIHSIIGVNEGPESMMRLWGLSDYEARKDGGISMFFFFRIFIHWRLISFQHVAISKREIMQILFPWIVCQIDEGKHKKSILVLQQVLII